MTIIAPMPTVNRSAAPVLLGEEADWEAEPVLEPDAAPTAVVWYSLLHVTFDGGVAEDKSTTSAH